MDDRTVKPSTKPGADIHDTRTTAFVSVTWPLVGGQRYSGPLEKLEVSAEILAYQEERAMSVRHRG
jgi:hypothetical protein